MPFKWKVFNVSLFGGMILSIFSFGGWTAFYIRIHPVFTIGTHIILFFVALVVTILFTFFPFWIFKEKFPDGIITNTIEGIMYLLSFLLFIACLYIMFFGSMYLEAIINNTRPADNWIIFSKYLSIETVILSAVHIYIGINGLLLIKTISKNRWNTIRKISELGKS